MNLDWKLDVIEKLAITVLKYEDYHILDTGQQKRVDNVLSPHARRLASHITEWTPRVYQDFRSALPGDADSLHGARPHRRRRCHLHVITGNADKVSIHVCMINVCVVGGRG